MAHDRTKLGRGVNADTKVLEKLVAGCETISTMLTSIMHNATSFYGPKFQEFWVDVPVQCLPKLSIRMAFLLASRRLMSTMPSLKNSSYVVLKIGNRLDSKEDTYQHGGVAQVGSLKPSKDGGPLRGIGMGDRGNGLIYKPGRLSAQADSTVSQELPDGVRVVKVQPPLDNSDDARGGMGRMTPTTLLVLSETGN